MERTLEKQKPAAGSLLTPVAHTGGNRGYDTGPLGFPEPRTLNPET